MKWLRAIEFVEECRNIRDGQEARARTTCTTTPEHGSRGLMSSRCAAGRKLSDVRAGGSLIQKEYMMASSTERPPLSKDDAAGADSTTPGVAPSGTGYRAMATSGDRIIWSCSHVHFTEHSAKACAERHLATARPPSAQER